MYLSCSSSFKTWDKQKYLHCTKFHEAKLHIAEISIRFVRREKKKKKERKNSSFLGDSGAVAQDSSVMMDVDTLGSKFSFNCSQQCF